MKSQLEVREQVWIIGTRGDLIRGDIIIVDLLKYYKLVLNK